MDKITEFLEEYKTFKEKAQGHKLTNDEIQFLFAVYLKNLRENMRFQKGGLPDKKTETIPATDKQKSYIKDIYQAKNIPFTEEQINGLTKQEASQLINNAINNSAGGAQ
jgi:hypothetical protein